VGDVGFGSFEEINQVPPISSGKLNNYGWPCFEGLQVTKAVQVHGFESCNNLYLNPERMTPALFQYSHYEQFGDYPTKAGGASAVTGVQIYQGTTFPKKYQNALFFSDYTRGGVWAILRNSTTTFDVEHPKMMIQDMSQLTDLQVGPDGGLYLCQKWTGEVYRYQASEHELPVASLKASVTSGPLPLTVTFDASESMDPKGKALSFEWDFLGNGKFEKLNQPIQRYTYKTPGSVSATVRVTSSLGTTKTAQLGIFPELSLNGAIGLSARTGEFNVGDRIRFHANVTDELGQLVPGHFLFWTVQISHCYLGPACRPNDVNCHQHMVNEFIGTSNGTVTAPDHEYPSWLTFNLKVKHPKQPEYISEFVAEITPRAVDAQVASDPPGLMVIASLETLKTPFKVPVLSNGNLMVHAIEVQMINRQAYRFKEWQHGGKARQAIQPQAGVVYTAVYEKFTVNNYEQGEGPSAPQNVMVTPGFKQCTVAWKAPAAIDAKHPIIGYIVYHRDFKHGAPVANHSTAMIPASSTSWTVPVDLGSECHFQVSVVTDQGESSFKSDMVVARTSLFPASGVVACPETECAYRAILFDDWNHPAVSKNLLGHWQECEHCAKFEPDQQSRLEVRTKGVNAYWYSVFAESKVHCFNCTQFSHLSFTIQGPKDADFAVGIDARDDQCNGKLPKIVAKVAQWTPEKKLTGQVQKVLIPLNQLTLNPKAVVSVFFNSFSVQGQSFFFDDLALVNICESGNEESVVAEVPKANTTLSVASDVSCKPLTIDEFKFNEQEQNNLKLWVGGAEATFTKANEGLQMEATSESFYFAEVLSSSSKCMDLSQYSHLTMTISPFVKSSDAILVLQETQENCGVRNRESRHELPLAPYITGNLMQVPLTAFPNANLTRIFAMVFEKFPMTKKVTVSNLQAQCQLPIVNSLEPSNNETNAKIDKKETQVEPKKNDEPELPSKSDTKVEGDGVLPRVDDIPKVTECYEMVLDDFRSLGEKNNLNLWAGGEPAKAIVKVGDKLEIAKGALYFASKLASTMCFDATAYQYLQFSVSGAPMTSFDVEIQTASEDTPCNNPLKLHRHRLPITSYLTSPLSSTTDKVVRIPLADFGSQYSPSKINAYAFTNFQGEFTIGEVKLINGACVSSKKGSTVE
jgi:PKD repeat protein